MQKKRGGEVLRDAETGEIITENMQERQVARYVRNGSLMSSAWLLTIKNWHAVVLLVLSFGALFGMIWTAMTFVGKPMLKSVIEESTEEMRKSLEEIRMQSHDNRETHLDLYRKISDAGASRWSLIDEQIQAVKMRELNPGLRIPDPIHHPLPGESQPQ